MRLQVLLGFFIGLISLSLFAQGDDSLNLVSPVTVYFDGYNATGGDGDVEIFLGTSSGGFASILATRNSEIRGSEIVEKKFDGVATVGFTLHVGGPTCRRVVGNIPPGATKVRLTSKFQSSWACAEGVDFTLWYW